MILLSCSEHDNTGGIPERIRAQLVDIAEGYITGQLTGTERATDENGIIRIGNKQITYAIDPSAILTGKINDDLKVDAIIPLAFYTGPFLQRTEHLFVMRKGNSFGIEKVLDTLMKVIEISEGVVYAEFSKVDPDSPMYGCSLCKEIVKYKFSNGDIVLAE